MMATLACFACGGAGSANAPGASSGSSGSSSAAFATVFSPAQAERLAAIWDPVTEIAEELETASGQADFVAYHAALGRTRSAFRTAVDETIATLGEDTAWRTKLLAEAMSDSEAAGSGQDSGSSRAMEFFPQIDQPADEWMSRGMLENPRLAGEMLRFFVDMQADYARLGFFFAGQMGQEMMKAAGEAAEGFRNPGAR